MAKVAVLLCGCGVYDGSEIYETTFTLLALEEAGAEVQCCAPDVEQAHVINHRTGEEVPGEKRSVLTESARLARGKIQPAADIVPGDFDALIVPGGFGAAKNLCDFAFKGPDCTVHPEVARLFTTFHEEGKPVGLICISPAIGAALLGSKNVRLTIGNDADTAAGLEKLGAEHCECPVEDIVVDEENRIVSTPAYMLGSTMGKVKSGIDKLVSKVLELA